MNKFNEKFGRIICPLLTPYDENEEVDYKKYGELVEYLITNNLCDTLLVTGTTGEAFLLTDDERIELLKTAITASAGRKPVIAGTGCASTKETVELTRRAVEAGADTVMVVAPYYGKPNQEGIYQHFKILAESTTADIVLYNIPIFTGVNIDPDTVHELAKLKNIVGIKDESGINPTQVTDYFRAVKGIDPDFAVFNGDDIMLLPTIAQGANGIVSGGSAIFGHEIRAIFDEFESGDPAKAEEINRVLFDFCKTLGQGGRTLPNSVLRPAVEAVSGVKLGPGRSPITKIKEEEWKVTEAVLKKAGKL